MYSFCSKTVESSPQERSESGASGSRSWTATSKSGWSAGIQRAPAGMRALLQPPRDLDDVTRVSPW